MLATSSSVYIKQQVSNPRVVTWAASVTTNDGPHYAVPVRSSFRNNCLKCLLCPRTAPAKRSFSFTENAICPAALVENIIYQSREIFFFAHKPKSKCKLAMGNSGQHKYVNEAKKFASFP